MECGSRPWAFTAATSAIMPGAIKAPSTMRASRARRVVLRRATLRPLPEKKNITSAAAARDEDACERASGSTSDSGAIDVRPSTIAARCEPLTPEAVALEGLCAAENAL